MASSDPTGDALALLTSVLGGDATFTAALPGGIHQILAPPGTSGDFCLLTPQSATDINAATAARLMTTLVVQVKCVGPAADETNLRSAYKRADALLQPSGRALANTDGTLACYREQAFTLGETDNNGVLWLHIGGLYRIEV